MIEVFCDGKTMPKNPGFVCVFAVIIYWQGISLRQKEMEIVGHIEQNGITNNVCEYLAVINALKEVERLSLEKEIMQLALSNSKQEDIMIFSDSQLVINQINGKWGCWDPKLQQLLEEVRILSKRLHQHGLYLRFMWIPRIMNKEADALTWKYYFELMKRDPSRYPPPVFRK